MTDYNKLLPDKIKDALPPLYSQAGVADPLVRAKWFAPWSNWTWYAIEGEIEGDDFTCFGLVSGFELELGYFSVGELASVDDPLPLIRVELDEHFEPVPLSVVKAKHSTI
jgi:hypothetical protein